MILSYDIVVIGAGHAGCEAATAAARLGSRTLLVTIDMEKIASMSCNPAVGGVAKGQIVREIDALGGAMGLITDSAAVHYHMLNPGKGPAVHSLRAQIDRRGYCAYMKNVIENRQNLQLKQAEIVSLTRDEDGLWHLLTRLEAEYTAKCVILATGTFLGGRIFVGEWAN